MIDRKLPFLTIMKNAGAHKDSMVTTLNTAVTETACEILGKYCQAKKKQKKKLWVTAEILDLSDKRRELRKKRFKPEGAEKQTQTNNKHVKPLKREKGLL